MKYVIMIHSNPQPWGHPTGDFLAEHRDRPAAETERANADFEAMLGELQENGELIGGEALGDPASAKLVRWSGGAPVVTDGPYAETKEHFAGFFLIDVADQARAEEIVRRFGSPGETIELRPTMWGGGEDV